MLDDLNELRTFARILADGSLTQAARHLGIGLAVASKRLASLERRAGVRLVNRTTRSLSPTAEGAALLVHVERALDAIAAGEARLADGRDTPFGLLRVCAPVSFGRRHVAPVLARLAADHPQLDADLRLSDSLRDLVEDCVDIAVRIGAPADSTLVMRRLADNRRVLAASPAYLDRRGRPGSVEAMAAHDCLHLGDGHRSWRLAGADGQSVTIPGRVRLRSDSGDAVHGWALDGLGIALKSEIDIAADLAAGRLERVLPELSGPPAPVYALFPSAPSLPAKVRAFIEAMAMHLDGANPDDPDASS